MIFLALHRTGDAAFALAVIDLGITTGYAGSHDHLDGALGAGHGAVTAADTSVSAGCQCRLLVGLG